MAAFLIGYLRKSVPLAGLKPSRIVGIKNGKGAIKLEKVKVIDAVMGACKTTWALNAPAGEEFIYIEIIDNRVVWTASGCYYVCY
ncbi:hypothetical protein BpJC7_26170 [Weizmannia acidilactici]|uniref:Uncharacterized protein n=1 Tax=Weizmannia acidilactici TaxID=2607726 RepID=A0A5J4JQG5_9BACI|nr:hypothetical protein BpJC7_26170 [Weizmannia acidilactici]